MLQKPLNPTLLLIFAASLILPLAQSLAATAPSTPNILIIYADDMGFGDLNCQNPDSKIPTPNLDKLASEGMRFIDGHSSSGVCTPSRYALLTGRYHWRKFYGIVGAFGKSVFSPERLTLPEMLQQKGYHTAAIGKWHLGWDWDSYRKPDAKPAEIATKKGKRKKKTLGPEAFDWSKPIPDGPLAHGFDHYFGDTVINFPPYCWIEDDRVVNAPDVIMDSNLWKPIKEGNWECRPGPMYSEWDPYENIPTTTARAVQYIEQQAEQTEPFFLYFAFPSPHAPIIPNDAFDGSSQAGAYGDFVVETDDACGQLLRSLEASGQADNTIVVFSADNGAERYAYERDKKYDHWSSGPFRGLKQDIYEGGHHVPFLVRWPGTVKADTVSEALVSQIDLMATFAAVVDFPLPDDQAEDSHNLLPLLDGSMQGVRPALVHSTWERTGFGLRTGDWVLINKPTGYARPATNDWLTRHDYPADDDSPVELYNLADDIGQRHNLATENPERVEAMQAILKNLQDDGHSAPRLLNN
ncbi:MAG: arylsulfatase [Opitutae bacterium]|nr:arylsulfatase [Opitutae bacterium]